VFNVVNFKVHFIVDVGVFLDNEKSFFHLVFNGAVEPCFISWIPLEDVPYLDKSARVAVSDFLLLL